MDLHKIPKLCLEGERSWNAVWAVGVNREFHGGRSAEPCQLQDRCSQILIQGQRLTQVIRGFNAYHAIATNYLSLVFFRDRVTRLWKRALMRLGQRASIPWERMMCIRDDYLPSPCILHLWPERRFGVKHPRSEPCA